jgi:hypothetical protein
MVVFKQTLAPFRYEVGSLSISPSLRASLAMIALLEKVLWHAD